MVPRWRRELDDARAEIKLLQQRVLVATEAFKQTRAALLEERALAEREPGGRDAPITSSVRDTITRLHRDNDKLSQELETAVEKLAWAEQERDCYAKSARVLQRELDDLRAAFSPVDPARMNRSTLTTGRPLPVESESNDQ